MAINDKIILEKILAERQKERASALDESSFFEFFSAEQVLKEYDLSDEEISSGIVDGMDDGGIDSIYVVINGELLQEDTDLENFKKNIHIDVIVVQSKLTNGFSEDAIDKLSSTTKDLFDLSKPIADFKQLYNAPLLKIAEQFRNAYQGLAARFPKLKISYYYSSKGDEASIHPKVRIRAEKLKQSIQKTFSSVECTFEFLTDEKLVERARRGPTTSFSLQLAESPISPSGSSTGDAAFICLVSLPNYYKFITDPDGKIRRGIFEANVRDYQGKNTVNDQIQATLKDKQEEDFWWLNNGITVIASKATQTAKELTIESPEIVNGLQTSTEIHAFFSENPDAQNNESRNLLVRVIIPKVAASRDRIIRATNSQTAIPPASLRATDPIHRNLEEYLRAFNFYYDRRKNFYKNEGKPMSRIISIPRLAQAVQAILLSRPDAARARPSSLMNKDDDYSKLFNLDYPLQVYLACIEIIEAVDKYLSNHPDNLPATEKNNIKFYIAMSVAWLACDHLKPNAKQIADLAGQAITDEILNKAYALVKDDYTKLGGTDQVAKGTDMPRSIIQSLESQIPKTETGLKIV